MCLIRSVTSCMWTLIYLGGVCSSVGARMDMKKTCD